MTDDESLHAFDRLVSSLDYPLFIVSAAAHGDVGACLIGFSTQCSIHPSRFLVCLSKENRTYQIAREAGTLVVHRVGADQKDLAEHFGGTSQRDDPDKLAHWPWREGPDGTPVIAECDWFAGRVLERIDVGDHVAFVLEPFAGECGDDTQLGFQAARDIEAGQPA